MQRNHNKQKAQTGKNNSRYVSFPKNENGLHLPNCHELGKAFHETMLQPSIAEGRA